MAYWCVALSAASDYRPAFQLLRNPGTSSAGRGAAAPAASPDAVARSTSGAALDPQVRAREAIGKAMALREAVTPRERLYIDAMAARRAPGPKDAADAAYIAGLRKLVAAYPGDLEAKSMLGLALDNGFDPVTKEPREHTMEAIALLEEVVKKDDAAFGAHHYLIHGDRAARDHRQVRRRPFRLRSRDTPASFGVTRRSTFGAAAAKKEPPIEHPLHAMGRARRVGRPSVSAGRRRVDCRAHRTV